MTVRYAISALVLLILVGCASTPPRPVQSGFEDIPVPKGLEFRAEDSTIIESPSVKAARQVYTGRLEPQSLALAFRTTFEANGWRHITSIRIGLGLASHRAVIPCGLKRRRVFRVLQFQHERGQILCSWKPAGVGYVVLRGIVGLFGRTAEVTCVRHR
jgi:hypothetical protein